VGMRRAEVEHVKAFASKTEDRARPAYGRFRVDRPRCCVFCATTNADAYLKSDTGDRRFWPLQTGKVELDALERDRDQLWAEAVHAEQSGESLTLDWRLWPEAARVQASRQERDVWQSDIAAQIEKKNIQDTSVAQVLGEFLRLEIGHCGQTEMNRAARVLRALGFERYHKRMGNSFEWRYKRS
jgi:predicted P-loop ATPase